MLPLNRQNLFDCSDRNRIPEYPVSCISPHSFDNCKYRERTVILIENFNNFIIVSNEPFWNDFQWIFGAVFVELICLRR